MRPPLRLILAGFAILACLNGCAAGKAWTKEELEKRSVVFVYLDDSDMSGDFEWFSLRELRQGEAPLYWAMAVRGKWAYHIGIPKGSFQISGYGGSSGFDLGCIKLCSNTDYTYRFPSQGHGFRVDKRGVYFLGAFRHKKAGGFFESKFDVEPIKHPNEKEAVAEILEVIAKAHKGEPDRIEPTLKLLRAHLKGL